jgi:hypothetical protein
MTEKGSIPCNNMSLRAPFFRHCAPPPSVIASGAKQSSNTKNFKLNSHVKTKILTVFILSILSIPLDCHVANAPRNDKGEGITSPQVVCNDGIVSLRA